MSTVKYSEMQVMIMLFDLKMSMEDYVQLTHDCSVQRDDVGQINHCRCVRGVLNSPTELSSIVKYTFCRVYYRGFVSGQGGTQ